MSARSPREDAIAALRPEGCPRQDAARYVDTVLRILEDTNDRRTMEAGAAEVLLAMPLGVNKGYARNIAGVIWRAMLAAAR